MSRRRNAEEGEGKKELIGGEVEVPKESERDGNRRVKTGEHVHFFKNVS